MQLQETLIKEAKTRHQCSWCDEPIWPGLPYYRYGWKDEGGDIVTVKEHPECFKAMSQAVESGRSAITFNPGDHPRGGINHNNLELYG